MKIVIGLGFGDEGKGLTTSFLCSDAINPIVVRFNGGHQAGHTVVVDGKRHVFSSFGSGTLQGVPTFWSKNCTFYPIAFLNERDKLLELDPELTPKIYVDPLCPIVTPYDVHANQTNESVQHGTVGVGFGTTIKRHENYFKLYARDMFYDNIFKEKLALIRYAYYNDRPRTNDRLFDDFIESVKEARKYITLSDQHILGQYMPIFEGAQGVLLDQDFGFFPNVTRSNTTSKNALDIINTISNTFGTEIELYYVIRTYQTRHGNGFMTNEGKELNLVNNENETNVFGEYQGEFRKSPLDFDLVKYAIECDNTFSKGFKKNLVVTCYDQHKIDIWELVRHLGVSFNSIYVSNGPSFTDIKRF